VASVVVDAGDLCRFAVNHRVMTEVRTFVDAQGTEWEVYGEQDWGARGLLDWDYLPQGAPSGLLFISKTDLRRFYPAPANWQQLSDADLADYCARALSVY
jgi:hypothetical protein